MKTRKTKQVPFAPGEWRRLAELVAGNRTLFLPEILRNYELRRQESAHRHARLLARMSPDRRRSDRHRVLESVFGTFRPDHSFGTMPVEWGCRLTEPNATKAFKHFLDRGPPDLRGRRIEAFLRALGTEELPSSTSLQRTVVQAEIDRIDLEIRVPIEGSRLYRPIIIEAKLGHSITETQLSRYRKLRASDKALDFGRADLVILGLTENARKGLKGQQVNIWRLVTWRDLWLRFEKLRPEGDDPQLSLFLHTLWRRIGGLAPERTHA